MVWDKGLCQKRNRAKKMKGYMIHQYDGRIDPQSSDMKTRLVQVARL